MFIDPNGNLYAGEMRVGDREATPEEIAAWSVLRQPTKLEQIQTLLMVASIGMQTPLTRYDVWNCILATESGCQALATANSLPVAAVIANAYSKMSFYRKCKDLEAAIRVIETS